jgi:hypothetical protein
MAQGRSNAAIAGTLVISAGVVEKHVASHPLAQVTAHGEGFGQALTGRPVREYLGMCLSIRDST